MSIASEIATVPVASSAISDVTNSSEVDGEVQADLLPVPQQFHVHDASTANWLLRAVLEKRRYIQTVEQWAAAEIRRAQREERFLLERYGPQMEQWVSQQIERLGGRRRSLFLPAGQVGYRKEREKLLVTDESRLLAWCRSHLPQAIKVSAEAFGAVAEQLRQWTEQHGSDVRLDEQVLKSIVHEHVCATGECPDGTELAAGADRFFLR